MFENAPEIVNVMLLATIAGFISSIFGGLLAICFSRPNKKLIGLSFFFVAAVLLTLVFVDFLPHAIGHGHYHVGIDQVTGVVYQYWYQHSGAGIWLTVLGITVGVGLVVVLSFFDKYGHEHVHGVLPHTEECTHDEVANELTGHEKRRLLLAAIPVALAIILHDLPKGLAIGASGAITTALIIGLSCIPEGMSIAIPLKAGGAKIGKILGVCGLAGLATVLGAIIGYLVGGMNVYVSGFMFAVATGCIIGVVFSEIIPFAVEYSDRSKWKFLVVLIGVLLVIVLNYFFHGLTH